MTVTRVGQEESSFKGMPTNVCPTMDMEANCLRIYNVVAMMSLEAHCRNSCEKANDTHALLYRVLPPVFAILLAHYAIVANGVEPPLLLLDDDDDDGERDMRPP